MKQDYFILSTESNIFPEFDPVGECYNDECALASIV